MNKSRAILAALALSFATSVGAIPPEIQVLDFDFAPFKSTILSQACAIPVYEKGSASVTVKLFYDANGQVRFELDDYAFTPIKYYSPREEGGTGEEVSAAGARREHNRLVYPVGTGLGAPVTIYTTGSGPNLWPGYFGDPPPGMVVYSGEVVDTWNGIPIVEIVDLLAAYGSKKFSLFDYLDHVCVALGSECEFCPHKPPQ